MPAWMCPRQETTIGTVDEHPCCVSRSLAECGIRVLAQEVPQRRDELPSMSNIVLPNGRANLSDQHVPDRFAPALALKR